MYAAHVSYPLEHVLMLRHLGKGLQPYTLGFLFINLANLFNRSIRALVTIFPFLKGKMNYL